MVCGIDDDCSIKRTDLTPGIIAAASTGLLLFSLALAFGVYNSIKFWQHRSLPMGLFYILAILNLLCRVIFYGSIFVWENTYYDVFLFVGPSFLSCSVGISQFMSYLILIMKMDFYIKIMKNRPEVETVIFT